MAARENNFVSVVIYIYNDADIIQDELGGIHELLSEKFVKYELICVNDDSTDESLKQIRDFAAKVNDCPVSLINMGYYHGMEAAMKAGVDLSIGDFVFEFDRIPVDFDLSLMTDIFEKALSGYDIVNARPRNMRGRKSMLFYRIFNLFSISGQKLGTEYFRLLSRRTINRVDAIGQTVFYRKAVYSSCGLKMANIFYENRMLPSRKSNSKQRKNRRNMAMDSLVLFTDLAYKISFVFCILMALFMLGTGAYTVAVYFGQKRPVEGWAPLMGMISAGFFGVFGIQTIIIKYLELILSLVFKKQKYLISSIEKLK